MYNMMIVASALNVQITKALCAETFNQQTGSWLEWLRNFTQKCLGPSTTEESVTWNGTLQYYVAGGHRGRKITHTRTHTPQQKSEYSAEVKKYPFIFWIST